MNKFFNKWFDSLQYKLNVILMFLLEIYSDWVVFYNFPVSNRFLDNLLWSGTRLEFANGMLFPEILILCSRDSNFVAAYQEYFTSLTAPSDPQIHQVRLEKISNQVKISFIGVKSYSSTYF